MILRQWTGVVRRERAEDYVRHLQTETLGELSGIEGFLEAAIVRRDVDAGVEYQVMTVWESLESVRAFAGDDVEAAVVPDVAREMMVDFDGRVRHYRVVHSTR